MKSKELLHLVEQSGRITLSTTPKILFNSRPVKDQELLRAAVMNYRDLKPNIQKLVDYLQQEGIQVDKVLFNPNDDAKEVDLFFDNINFSKFTSKVQQSAEKAASIPVGMVFRGKNVKDEVGPGAVAVIDVVYT